MASQSHPNDPPRRWGDDSALFDDEEARRRLVEAVGRCIVRRGSVRIGMADVANEAGVARSTVYRYFPSRADLLIELMVRRTDAAFARIVKSLVNVDDARHTIPELILLPLDLVAGNPLNEALFSDDSRSLLFSIELGAEPLVDVVERHYGPLFERWQAAGQVHPDLDVRETIRWTNLVAIALLSPPWTERSRSAKRDFLEQYVVRALVTESSSEVRRRGR